MNAVAELPVMPIGPMIRATSREARNVKDKRYRRCPVGATVWRFYRELQYAGYAKTTLDSYEQVLAWLAKAHDDFPDVARFCEPDGREYLQDFMYDNWGASAEKTRAHRRTVLNVFFTWTTSDAIGLTPFNPMAGIRGPRSPRTVRERNAYEQELVLHLVDAQETLRDRCALGVLRLALRKNDLRMLQLRDIDLKRDVLRLNHAKGGERHRLPIELPDLRSDLELHLFERGLTREGDVGEEYLIWGRRFGPLVPMDPASVHRWFKRCLANAGLPASIQMHELRHTALDHVWRTTGNIVIAQKLARHKSPATTAGYLHPSDEDLREGLRQVVRSAEERDG